MNSWLNLASGSNLYLRFSSRMDLLVGRFLGRNFNEFLVEYRCHRDFCHHYFVLCQKHVIENGLKSVIKAYLSLVHLRCNCPKIDFLEIVWPIKQSLAMAVLYRCEEWCPQTPFLCRISGRCALAVLG